MNKQIKINTLLYVLKKSRYNNVSIFSTLLLIYSSVKNNYSK